MKNSKLCDVIAGNHTERICATGEDDFCYWSGANGGGVQDSTGLKVSGRKLMGRHLLYIMHTME